MEVLAEQAAPMASFIMAHGFPASQGGPGYIDPGTGSLVIQLVIGAVAGGLVAIRVFWGRIRKKFRNSVLHIRESDESSDAKE